MYRLTQKNKPVTSIENVQADTKYKPLTSREKTNHIGQCLYLVFLMLVIDQDSVARR